MNKKSLRIIAVDNTKLEFSLPCSPGQSNWRDRLNESKKHLLSFILDLSKPSERLLVPLLQFTTIKGIVHFLSLFSGRLNKKYWRHSGMLFKCWFPWDMEQVTFLHVFPPNVLCIFHVRRVQCEIYSLCSMCILTALTHHHPKHKSYQ